LQVLIDFLEGTQDLGLLDGAAHAGHAGAMTDDCRVSVCVMLCGVLGEEGRMEKSAKGEAEWEDMRGNHTPALDRSWAIIVDNMPRLVSAAFVGREGSNCVWF
jgi:hypothetical protein